MKIKIWTSKRYKNEGIQRNTVTIYIINNNHNNTINGPDDHIM